MRVDRELHRQFGLTSDQTRSDVSAAPDQAAPRTRRVSVQLSKRIFEQLEAATERPGVGKSMVIEDALDRFLSPAPSIEAVLRDQFEQLNARLDGFDRDIRSIAETVALHAQYQLAARASEQGKSDRNTADDLIAAAGEGGSNLNFQCPPN